MSIISNVIYPSDIISIGGNVAIIILTFLLSLSFVMPNNYFNKISLNVIDSNSKMLLLIFIAVIVFKILIIISKDDM